MNTKTSYARTDPMNITMMTRPFHPVSLIILLFVSHGTWAFVQPQPFAVRQDTGLHVSTESSFVAEPSPVVLLSAVSEEINNEVTAAFTDQVDLFGDPTIKILVGVFGLVIVLLVTAKNLLGQMDMAIEKILIEFESTMRRKYAKRWAEMEKELEGLNEEERAQKLFVMMEKMEEEEPEFMARVNEDIAK